MVAAALARHGPFAGLGGCQLACCAPNTRKELLAHRTPLSIASRYAFLLCVRLRKWALPKEVLVRIIEQSAVEERRLVAAPLRHASARRRHDAQRERGGVDALAMTLDGLDMGAPP